MSHAHQSAAIPALKPARVLVYGVLCLLLTGCAPYEAHIVETTQYRVGDTPNWAAKELDTSGWLSTPVLSLPDSAAVMWLRFEVPIPAYTTLGFKATGLAAREVYWDGVLLDRIGRVGASSETERAGPIDAYLRIPDSLATPGTHQVAVRISSFLRPKGTSGLRMQFIAGDYAKLTSAPYNAVGIPLLFLGGFVIVALYYGALFIADQKRLPYLMTAALCFAVALLLMAESWRNALGYDYTLHGLRLGLVDLFTGITGILLASTFIVQFALPKGRAILLVLSTAIAASLLLINDHETGTYIAFALALGTALGITGWAARQQLHGALLACSGVAFCLLVLLFSGDSFMDLAFFPAFGVLIAGLLTSVGMQTRADRRRHAIARATAARLEAELLKKHLQPHFLMNTLTSIIELVETSPHEGVNAIEALASELRSLGEISGERTIAMRQELALCRAHLEVMGYRRALTFKLDASEVSEDGPIPPAVIHTLLENAITHNAYTTGTVTFTLRETLHDDQRSLVLRTPLAQPDPQRREEGGGLRYVRARLEEVAPGQVILSSGIEADDWVTRIQLPANLPPSLP